MGTPDGTNVLFLQALPAMDQLAKDLPEICQHADSVTFLCFEIASLHKINYVYGRRVGDALLAAAVQWMLELEDGTLYRIRGNSFCLMLANTELNQVYHYASALDARFGQIWKLTTGPSRTDVFAQASIAILRDLGCDYEQELPELFDWALETAGEDQRIIIFDAEYANFMREHVRLQMELKSCIFSNMLGFDVYYQPLADPSTGTWRGLEALCRWAGPTIGPVPPDIFIGEAEKLGMIHELGSWVLDTSLQTCKELRLDELDQFIISVNVSALQLSKCDFVSSVLNSIKRHHFPCDKLMLEITESTQFVFNEVTISAIETLRAQGILFALDDFGSGYSGFANLKNLPADMLKTERTFIENIENDSYLQYFYYIMSETAHANGMRLIAEGVETPEQLRNVAKNGADLIQGYLFGKPMDKQALKAHLSNFTQPLTEFDAWRSDVTDFKHWIHGQNAYKITPSLFRLQSKCIGIILDEADLDSAFNQILGAVGGYFKVGRVYVFLREQDAIFNNVYEWCAEGVESQMHLFQQVDANQDGFYQILQENEIVMATTAGQLPQNMQTRLARANMAGTVQSMVVMPMKQRGEILGFVGFDDHTTHDWMPEELIMLHNLCLLCLIILEKKQKMQ